MNKIVTEINKVKTIRCQSCVYLPCIVMFSDKIPDFPQVYCEMRVDGGWTVFQKRSHAAVSFNRRWAEYKHGFGTLTRK